MVGGANKGGFGLRHVVDLIHAGAGCVGALEQLPALIDAVLSKSRYLLALYGARLDVVEAGAGVVGVVDGHGAPLRPADAVLFGVFAVLGQVVRGARLIRVLHQAQPLGLLEAINYRKTSASKPCRAARGSTCSAKDTVACPPRGTACRSCTWRGSTPTRTATPFSEPRTVPGPAPVFFVCSRSRVARFCRTFHS